MDWVKNIGVGRIWIKAEENKLLGGVRIRVGFMVFGIKYYKIKWKMRKKWRQKWN